MTYEYPAAAGQFELVVLLAMIIHCFYRSSSKECSPLFNAVSQSAARRARSDFWRSLPIGTPPGDTKGIHKNVLLGIHFSDETVPHSTG